MPNRILRDYTDSVPVNRLDWLGECLFVRLIQKADDYGRFHGNPTLVKSLLFPLKDGLRDSDISARLSRSVREHPGTSRTLRLEAKAKAETIKRERKRACAICFSRRLNAARGSIPACRSLL